MSHYVAPAIRLVILACVLPLLLAPIPAAGGSLSDDQVVTTLQGKELKEILSAEGYGDIEVDDDDDLVFKIEGTNVLLFTSSDHSNLLAAVAWRETDASLRKVNAWNQSKKFSRAYIDDDGDPVLELDLDLDGGVTVARVKDFIETVKLSISMFRQEVL